MEERLRRKGKSIAWKVANAALKVAGGEPRPMFPSKPPGQSDSYEYQQKNTSTTATQEHSNIINHGTQGTGQQQWQQWQQRQPKIQQQLEQVIAREESKLNRVTHQEVVRQLINRTPSRQSHSSTATSSFRRLEQQQQVAPTLSRKGRESELCRVCAQQDWEYHLNRYSDERFRMDSEFLFQNTDGPNVDIVREIETTRPRFQGTFQLREYPNDHSGETIIQLRPYAQMLGRFQEQCVLCRMIVKAAINPQWPGGKDFKSETDGLGLLATKPVVVEIVGKPRTLASGNDLSCVFMVTVDRERNWKSFEAKTKFVRRNQREDQYMMFPSPTEINVNSLESWWVSCKEKHGDICANPNSTCVSTITDAFRVVDVHAQVVVPIPRGARYLALSYRWGDFEGYISRAQDFIEGQLPLKDKALPRTIVDAIALTKVIGEKYIWIDSLCIIQDDPEDVNKHVFSMDKVYKAASLTVIIASGESADSGIEGLRPGSRNLSFAGAIIGGVELVALPTPISLESSLWAERAWTYQEFYFSTKRLIFVGGRAFYQCLMGVRSEHYRTSVREFSDEAGGRTKTEKMVTGLDLKGMLYGLHADTKTRRGTSGSKVELRRYIRSAHAYGRRQASNQSDSLNAFQGILEYMHLNASTKFCWGLPTSHFHIALTWNVHSIRSLKGRGHVGGTRVAEWQAEHTRWSRSVPNGDRIWFPSWSWASSNYFFGYSALEDRETTFNDPDIGSYDLNLIDTDIKSSIVWPWDSAYNLDGPDPFQTGVLRIEGEVTELGNTQIRQQYSSEHQDYQVFLDDLTLPPETWTCSALDDGPKFSCDPMTFLKVCSKPSEYLLIGITPSLNQKGTHRRVCSAVVDSLVWDSAKKETRIVDLA